MILYVLHDDLGIEPIYEGTNLDQCTLIQNLFEAAGYKVERTIISIK